VIPLDTHHRLDLGLGLDLDLGDGFVSVGAAAQTTIETDAATEILCCCCCAEVGISIATSTSIWIVTAVSIERADEVLGSQILGMETVSGRAIYGFSVHTCSEGSTSLDNGVSPPEIESKTETNSNPYTQDHAAAFFVIRTLGAAPHTKEPKCCPNFLRWFRRHHGDICNLSHDTDAPPPSHNKLGEVKYTLSFRTFVP